MEGAFREHCGDGLRIKKLENEMITWLQVHGVLVQLALDPVFDVIGSLYGTVVQPDNMTEEDSNSSYAYIVLNWRGGAYQVWIDEDVGEWVPESIEEIEGDVDSFEKEDNTCDVDMRPELENPLAVVGECSVDELNPELEVGEIQGENSSKKTATRNNDSSNNTAENSIFFNITSNLNSGSNLVQKKFRRKSGSKTLGDSIGPQDRPKKRPKEDSDPLGWTKLLVFSQIVQSIRSWRIRRLEVQ
ncbi:hypothetical protein Hanom_Chr09g00775071 [Helianthus anomalus]